MDFSCLTEEEIRRKYREAKDKQRIIGVLADITCSTKDHIQEFLGLTGTEKCSPQKMKKAARVSAKPKVWIHSKPEGTKEGGFTMAEYIERGALLKDIYGYIPLQNIPYVEYLIKKQPAADVEEVVPELRKAVELLRKEYEKAKKNPIVRDPLAYALYQVWKMADEKGR